MLTELIANLINRKGSQVVRNMFDPNAIEQMSAGANLGGETATKPSQPAENSSSSTPASQVKK